MSDGDAFGEEQSGNPARETVVADRLQDVEDGEEDGAGAVALAPDLLERAAVLGEIGADGPRFGQRRARLRADARFDGLHDAVGLFGAAVLLEPSGGFGNGSANEPTKIAPEAPMRTTQRQPSRPARRRGTRAAETKAAMGTARKLTN